MQPPSITDFDQTAFFLDFDGTLVEIAPTPDAVRLCDAARGALRALLAATHGAVAIVTGREIEAIDDFVAPLRLPVAGVHGLCRRDAAGIVYAQAVDLSFLEGAGLTLDALARQHPGLLVERKSRSIALHYRSRPDCEALCRSAMEEIVGANAAVGLMQGKMVVEARAEGADKGTAIAAFLREEPFLGRRPVFAGDDVTDEDAFRAVNALDGVSIKVGPGVTQARYRLEDTAAFIEWLCSISSTQR
ncbi:MAG: trehalose-phosphatase [Hyphomicrobiaceae bacterium]